MRFHVLGIGPIGSLVAFHLRRTLPSRHTVSLVVRAKARARDLRSGAGIAIEHGGVAITQGGYDVELFDPMQEVVFDLVYNKHGEMRLPPGASRGWQRAGEVVAETHMDIIKRPIESVIVCTKADSALPVFERIKQRLTPQSTIVLLHNGMGVYERLVANVFRNPLERPQFVLATTTHGARSKHQGDMVHTVHTGTGELSFGIIPDPLGERDFEQATLTRQSPFIIDDLNLDDIAPPPSDDNDQPKDRCASLRETIAALSGMTDLNPLWHPISDLNIRLRRKLVVNSCINPLTTITQSSNGAFVADQYAQRITKKICAEAAAVFAAEAAWEAATYPTDESAAPTDAPLGLRAEDLEEEINRVARKTSNNFSSMLQDIWKGRRTEVEYLNGYLQQLGLKFGVPTPNNDLLYEIIKMKERVVPAARV